MGEMWLANTIAFEFAANEPTGGIRYDYYLSRLPFRFADSQATACMWSLSRRSLTNDRLTISLAVAYGAG
jgi:hypothetical protein